eukprot:Gb_10296 [translate_table: standard]
MSNSLKTAAYCDTHNARGRTTVVMIAINNLNYILQCLGEQIRRFPKVK